MEVVIVRKGGCGKVWVKVGTGVVDARRDGHRVICPPADAQTQRPEKASGVASPEHHGEFPARGLK